MKQTVLEEDIRVKLYDAEGEYDFEIKHFMATFSLNTCGLLRGIKKNYIARIVGAEYLRSMSQNYSCPLKKGLQVSRTAMKFTDEIFPKIDIRFKLEFDGFGRLKGQKKFTKMYSSSIYGKIKK